MEVLLRGFLHYLVHKYLIIRRKLLYLQRVLKQTTIMASIPPKKFTLRAFKIANPSVTSPDSGILGLLEQKLTPELTSGERRMPLNVDEPDRELLASYSWSGSRSFLFGMMLRVIPADNGGMISEELFNQPMITMNQVASSSSSESQYKDHFYFALDNNYLVTTLSGNINISRLQTYLNSELAA